jgi:hypothetical protein
MCRGPPNDGVQALQVALAVHAGKACIHAALQKCVGLYRQWRVTRHRLFGNKPFSWLLRKKLSPVDHMWQLASQTTGNSLPNFG